jgi:hypothetical protein
LDPLPLLSPLPAVLLLSLLPQAERTSVHAAARAATDAHFDVAIDSPVPCSVAPTWATPAVTTLTPNVVAHNIPTLC